MTFIGSKTISLTVYPPYGFREKKLSYQSVIINIHIFQSYLLEGVTNTILFISFFLGCCFLISATRCDISIGNILIKMQTRTVAKYHAPLSQKKEGV
jgi:hypothetical protein